MKAKWKTEIPSDEHNFAGKSKSGPTIKEFFTGKRKIINNLKKLTLLSGGKKATFPSSMCKEKQKLVC